MIITVKAKHLLSTYPVPDICGRNLESTDVLYPQETKEQNSYTELGQHHMAS